MKTNELLKQADEKSGESSVSLADEDFESEDKARKIFVSLKTKILSIAEWNAHALMSSYALFDASGREIENGKLAAGLFIRISIKGSGKYDWIRIEKFFEVADEFIITVRPAFDPTVENRDEKIVSHFFTNESTNNFCICKKETSVVFYVIGLDEKMNTNDTSGTLETVRNVAVNLGTYFGTQKSEWEKFCHHFLKDVSTEIET